MQNFYSLQYLTISLLSSIKMLSYFITVTLLSFNIMDQVLKRCFFPLLFLGLDYKFFLFKDIFKMLNVLVEDLLICWRQWWSKRSDCERHLSCFSIFGFSLLFGNVYAALWSWLVWLYGVGIVAWHSNKNVIHPFIVILFVYFCCSD